MENSNVTPLMPKEKTEQESILNSLSPREIVSELDRFVVGQNKAKRAVAIALRNRWRRQALKGDMKDEVLPKNILMIGPTGVGKTEISRRLSKLAEAPFVKVEASKFTEVGYVGRDVTEQIFISDQVLHYRAHHRLKQQALKNLTLVQQHVDPLIDTSDVLGGCKLMMTQPLLCVGLDPDPARIPVEFLSQDNPIFAFNKMIIDATADYACCYKPQFAHFAAVGAEAELQLTIDYIQSVGIPVILDAKRGDVGSTGDFYAQEAFDRYHADAVTANPYMGSDSLKPLLEREDKGVLLLCRTSNPGGADLQNLVLATGEQLFERVADLAANQWNKNSNVGLVVGATQPEEERQEG